MVRRLLFRLARSRWGGAITGRAFRYGWWLLPVRRLASTRFVLAFPHPRPTGPVHLLIVPKRAILSFASLRAGDVPVLDDLFAVAARLTSGLGDSGSVVLVINGGHRQDVPQVHAHLMIDPGLAAICATAATVPPDLTDDSPAGSSVTVAERGATGNHLVVRLPASTERDAGWPTVTELASIQRLLADRVPPDGGYSLVVRPGEADATGTIHVLIPAAVGESSVAPVSDRLSGRS